jgi:TIR domain
MPGLRAYKAFFSYAHDDARSDPELVRSLTEDLEVRVNAKLAKAKFSIWRDEKGLRTGSAWSERIEMELRSSDILIVLLSPRWIDSDFICNLNNPSTG